MKFYRKIFYPGVVPEWSPKYIEFLQLLQLISELKKNAINDAKQRAVRNEDVLIDLEGVVDNKVLLSRLEKQIQTVHDFYKEQLGRMTEQFELLLSQSKKLKLIQDFTASVSIPSEVEREVALSLIKQPPNKVSPKSRSKKEPPRKENTVKKNQEQQPLLGEEKVSINIQTDDILNTPRTYFTSYVSGHKKKVKELREAFMEFYRGCIMLQNFCNLNSEAVFRLLKRFDKIFGTETQRNYFIENKTLEEVKLHTSLAILIRDIEEVFTRCFFDGDKKAAMETLRIPKDRQRVGKTIFRLGLYLGVIVTLLFYITYILSYYPAEKFPHFSSVVTVYRAVGLVVLIMWGWAVDMFVWTRNKINYVFIFEFESRKHIRYQNMFEAAALMTLLLCLSFAAYLMGTVTPSGLEFMKKIPFQFHPIFILGSLFLVFVIQQFRTNFWMLRTCSRILIAPFAEILYRDFFIADQLVSLSIVLSDMGFSICFLTHDAWGPGTNNYCSENVNPWLKPLLAALPSYFRLIQCLRRYYDTKDPSNFINAGKYSCNFFVVAFSAKKVAESSNEFFVLWVLAASVATIYAFIWDLVKDWSLTDPNHKFLRKTLLYKRPGYYYAAMIGNLFMRCGWSLTISASVQEHTMNPLAFQSVLAAVEICRRSMWNLFRLENEQVSNVDRFRATHVVVPPIVDTRINFQPLKWFQSKKLFSKS